MTGRSALYVGSVIHRRLRPRPHRLRYRVFWMLLDIDAIDAADSELRWFSRNRFNLVSFRDADHGDGSDTPLRAQIDRKLDAAGIDTGGGPIRLLCMPRILGYGFNPLSVFFCHRKDGSLAAILYEVHNTFGERHTYLIPVADDGGPTVHQQCDKDFYVSPFLDMAMRYDFRVAPPGERVSVAIRGDDDDGPMIVAALSGNRTDLTDGALLKLLVTHPLLTFKVIAGIHWHALRMILKGFRLYRRPQPAPTPTIPVKTTE